MTDSGASLDHFVRGIEERVTRGEKRSGVDGGKGERVVRSFPSLTREHKACPNRAIDLGEQRVRCRH
jgi:hypothetical protein